MECLDIGTDDYLVRPFGMGELLATLRAALRRAFGVPRGEVFTSGNLRVQLTATTTDLLKLLVSHAGSVMTHRQFIHEIWGGTKYHDAVHLLRVTVSNLRRKLVDDSSSRPHIITEMGVGYRLRSNPD
jgi:two-component system KDP operon response regulator KdpE